MKTKTKTIVAISIVTLLAIVGGIIYSKAVKALPPDDVDAKLMRFDGVNGHRYTEIFLIGGNGITKHLVGGVYNTLGLNDSGNGDTCPQEVLDKVDVHDLAKEYNMLMAYRNGPRLWTLDWVEVKAAKERDFNGLKARWVMWLEVPKELIEHVSPAYKHIAGKRDTHFGDQQGHAGLPPG